MHLDWRLVHHFFKSQYHKALVCITLSSDFQFILEKKIYIIV